MSGFEQTEQTSDGRAGPGARDAGCRAPLDPIAGVDLDTYSRIVKAVAVRADDAALPAIAADAGITPEAWQRAQRGWDERIRADPDVALAFRSRYRALG